MSDCKVLIVESSTKIKTITGILNKFFKKDKYIIIATSGHIRETDIKKTKVVAGHETIDIFWKVNTNGKKFLTKLEEKLNKKHKIELFLATDPDREGESIANEVREVFEEKGYVFTVKRIYFKSITEAEVIRAIQEQRPSLDQNLLEAYLARVMLDLKIGFNLSPLGWKFLSKCSSIGRVQTVVLSAIKQKEDSIKSFVAETFWRIKVATKTNLEFHGLKVDGVAVDKIENIQDATALFESLKAASFTFKGVSETVLHETPPQPFDFPSFQIAAFRTFGLSSLRTSSIGQKLYEMGLTTYPRTDSTIVSDEGKLFIKSHIEQLGLKFVDRKQLGSKSVKNKQEAHEALRATSFDISALSLKEDEMKAFNLIKDRSLAAFMESREYKRFRFAFVSACSRFELMFDSYEEMNEGFRAVYKYGFKSFVPVSQKQVESLKAFDFLLLEEQTKPPAHYNEASIIKFMSNNGIGRPSTYARTIQVLRARRYIQIKERQILINGNGILLVEFVQLFFSDYFNIEFTSNMEQNLNLITIGQLARESVVKKFFNEIDKKIIEVYNHSRESIVKSLDKILVKDRGRDFCNECKERTMILRYGRFGPFITCTNYPNCQICLQI